MRNLSSPMILLIFSFSANIQLGTCRPQHEKGSEFMRTRRQLQLPPLLEEEQFAVPYRPESSYTNILYDKPGVYGGGWGTQMTHPVVLHVQGKLKKPYHGAMYYPQVINPVNPPPSPSPSPEPDPPVDLLTSVSNYFWSFYDYFTTQDNPQDQDQDQNPWELKGPIGPYHHSG